jgi:hypothetical protein
MKKRKSKPEVSKPEVAIKGTDATTIPIWKPAIDNGHLSRIPHFGIWNPSIPEAAELVVVNMWFSGEIEGVEEPKDFDGAVGPWLKAALAENIAAFEARLSSAVNSGRLKASALKRDLDDQLIPGETHIYYDHLVGWMEERGLDPGDHMAEWVDSEATIDELICDEVAFLRSACLSGKGQLKRLEIQRLHAKHGLLDEAQELVAVQALLKAKTLEADQLKNELEQSRSDQPSKVDRPLHTRQRRTLLTIIAALCDQSGIDYKARGAAQRIKSATEHLGAPIDDGTIDKLLNEIPDALETRIK